ncbi:cleavage and polyadenylation specificity factor subunit 3-II-like [Impatiens glandulifera]|uniref:cleavage and polyadenylation specificity factor subunit 3-II-like n=1 Tax=Impatiens glandulifera TaxID=253017 RepID=UPI001FB154DE|nr:cleavage and polyadenylation specificity factor subunit 3-II-like [Impatiens glandulifera]
MKLVVEMVVLNKMQRSCDHCLSCVEEELTISCLVFGAGQEVGKSCVVLSINGRRIMFDCGMHMGHLDHSRYPDFSLISKSDNFDSALTCIIITHLY